MARFDRCRICDYTQAHGSQLLSIPPNGNGKVRRYGEDMLCDTCSNVIANACLDLRPPEETDEDLVLLEE